MVIQFGGRTKINLKFLNMSKNIKLNNKGEIEGLI